MSDFLDLSCFPAFFVGSNSAAKKQKAVSRIFVLILKDSSIVVTLEKLSRENFLSYHVGEFPTRGFISWREAEGQNGDYGDDCGAIFDVAGFERAHERRGEGSWWRQISY